MHLSAPAAPPGWTTSTAVHVDTTQRHHRTHDCPYAVPPTAGRHVAPAHLRLVACCTCLGEADGPLAGPAKNYTRWIDNLQPLAALLNQPTNSPADAAPLLQAVSVAAGGAMATFPDAETPYRDLVGEATRRLGALSDALDVDATRRQARQIISAHTRGHDQALSVDERKAAVARCRAILAMEPIPDDEPQAPGLEAPGPQTIAYDLLVRSPFLTALTLTYRPTMPTAARRDAFRVVAPGLLGATALTVEHLIGVDGL